MTSWGMNDASVPNHSNGNAFPHINNPNAAQPQNVNSGMMDPSAFMNNPAAAQFNQGQFSQAQAQAQMLAMQNNQMRNASPSFPNPMYATNSVIPSKRPRPSEGSIAGSPRPNPGMLPTTRADTPQQPNFPGFQQGAMPPGSGQPSPYPHLQTNGSANATPSPIMGSNQMRPGSVPQRVSTTSPHPFSPAAQAQQFAQPSPIPSDHGGTPQPNSYMQQQQGMQPGNFPQGFNPNFNTPSPSPARPPSTPNAMGQQMMPQQMGQMQPGMMQPGQMGMGQMGGPQMAQMAQMQQMQQQMGQMGQMPGQMYPQGMQQGRMDQQKMYMQMQQQMQQRQQQQHQQQQHQQQQHQQHQQQHQQMGNMPMPSQMQGQMPGQNMSPAQAQQQAQAHAQQQRNLMVRQQQMSNGQMPPNVNPAMRPQQPGMAPQQQQQQQQQQQHPQQQPPQLRNLTTPEPFLKQLAAFMQSKQLPFDPSPLVCDRPINLMQLFQYVFKNGGYDFVSQQNRWPHMANALGFNHTQLPMAPQQVKMLYERTLRAFEQHYRAIRGQQQQQQQGAQNMPAGQKMPLPGQMPPGQMPPGQMPPGQMPPGMVQPGQPVPMQQGQMQSPVKHMPPGGMPAGVNGFSTPHPPQGQPNHQSQGSRGSVSKNITPSHDDFAVPSPASKHGSISLPSAAHPEGHGSAPEAQRMQFPAPFAKEPDEYQPCSRYVAESGTHGGVNVEIAAKLGQEYQHWKPDIPPVNQLGNIDLHALTKSLQCGIHAEVRLALDTLTTLTGPQQAVDLELSKLEELLETLLECAEDQVELLAEHSEELSDEVLISPYEDVFRACRLEQLAIKAIHAMGTQEYELDHAADRLLCITTNLRNLSFFPGNQPVLAENESLIKFLCVVIRYLGTRNMLLRTHAITLDLMKDIVILLSNIANYISIPEREQAYYLLQFVLAFAPTPAPHLADAGKIYFASFEPVLHPYLPHAVDVLAKLFARDEPNRTHYKNIFALDAASSQPNELITRTFGLAISPIPDTGRDIRPPGQPSYIEARKPYVMQGLLAGNILASLVPDSDPSITRIWLSAGNGLAQNLFRIVRELVAEFERPTIRPAGGPRSQPKKDPELLYIAATGTSMLRKLSEKACDMNEPASSIPPHVVPRSDKILKALEMTSMEFSHGFLKDAVAFGALDQ